MFEEEERKCSKYVCGGGFEEEGRKCSKYVCGGGFVVGGLRRKGGSAVSMGKGGVVVNRQSDVITVLHTIRKYELRILRVYIVYG